MTSGGGWRRVAVAAAVVMCLMAAATMADQEESEGVTTAEFTENDLTQNFTGSDVEGDASGGGEGGSGVNDSQATPTSATNANNTEVGGAAEEGGGATEGEAVAAEGGEGITEGGVTEGGGGAAAEGEGGTEGGGAAGGAVEGGAVAAEGGEVVTAAGGGVTEGGGGGITEGGVTAAGGGGAEGGVVTGGENHTLTTEAGEAAVSEGNDDTTIPGGGGGTGGGGNDTDTVTTAPPANMTKVPVNVTTAAPTTSEMTCGVNTELIDGQCVCVTNWTHDPALPGTTHCPCPDLCAAHVVTCPAESTCYHLTCNLVTCSCPQHYKFDPFTASCQSPCQYFGDEVCGLGSGKKCKDSAEAERDYTCQCGSGYILANDTCQDVDECSGTGSSGVCGDAEQCVNVPGSHKCPCKQGYLRGSQGSCINVNECLNPSLHDCDHICVDTDPPAMYTCSCYTGYTWNDTQRRCVLNDISTGCECNDPERSLCYQPPGGEKQCSPRPGYKLQNSTFVDAAECVDKENVQAWCWKGGKCVEGEGGSRCECQDGYINVTLDYGRCTALECPAGTVVSGSQCVDPCTSVTCTPPFTCTQADKGVTECRCQSACQDLLQPGVSSSVYHSSLVLTTTTSPGDPNIAWRLTAALEKTFGRNNVEILSIKPKTTRKRSVSQLHVEFLVVTQQPNITQEVADAIKMQCEPSEDINPGVCVLAGGLVIQEDSITVENNDPCAEQPCPGKDVFTCRPRPNTTGRFVCSCKTGFLKVNVLGTPGMCKDVDECDGGERVCEEEHECINTPGSFVCRQNPSALGQNAKVMKKLAIAFGVLFFIALFVIVGFVYLLKKKSKSNRELVPMSATSGFDNDAYHK